MRRALSRTSVSINPAAAAIISAWLASCSSHGRQGGVSRIANWSGLIPMPTTRRPASPGSMSRQLSPRHTAKRSSAPSHNTSPRQHNLPPTIAAGRRIISNHGIVTCQRFRPM